MTQTAATSTAIETTAIDGPDVDAPTPRPPTPVIRRLRRPPHRPAQDDVAAMLEVVGQPSLDALVDTAVPGAIRRTGPCASTPPVGERRGPRAARAGRPQPLVPSMIGLGYYGTLTPAVVQRNVLENPAWYTAYTPYQPEISQGRLEALLNFQTVVSDLTGLPIAGASLLDESTAAAEAMTLMRRSEGSADAVLLVDRHVFPQTIAVMQTRALPLGIEVGGHRPRPASTAPTSSGGGRRRDVFGVLVQYPGADGELRDLPALTAAAHEPARSSRHPPTCSRSPWPRRRGSGAPTSPSAPASGSACRWASAARTRATCRVRDRPRAHMPGRLVGVSVDAAGHRPTGWRCRPVSSTSAARRRPPTSAPPRCCSP